MTTVTQCLVLLICVGFCTSAVIPRCLCVKTVDSVNETLVISVNVINASSYCGMRQVIVTLKKGRQRCLNPNSEFTIKLLENRKNGKTTSSKPKTTAASTTSAKIVVQAV